MKILYFARYKEQLGTDQELWTDLGGHQSIADVVATLKGRGEPWDAVFSSPNMLIAINQELATQESPVSLGDEVAFFPPVTGG